MFFHLQREPVVWFKGERSLELHFATDGHVGGNGDSFALGISDDLLSLKVAVDDPQISAKIVCKTESQKQIEWTVKLELWGEFAGANVKVEGGVYRHCKALPPFLTTSHRKRVGADALTGLLANGCTRKELLHSASLSIPLQPAAESANAGGCIQIKKLVDVDAFSWNGIQWRDLQSPDLVLNGGRDSENLCPKGPRDLALCLPIEPPLPPPPPSTDITLRDWAIYEQDRLRIHLCTASIALFPGQPFTVHCAIFFQSPSPNKPNILDVSVGENEGIEGVKAFYGVPWQHPCCVIDLPCRCLSNGSTAGAGCANISLPPIVINCHGQQCCKSPPGLLLFRLKSH